MCGIIAIVSREPTRARADARASCSAGSTGAVASQGDPAAVADAAAAVDDGVARPARACSALADRHDLVAALTVRLDQLDAYATAVDAALAEGSADSIDPDALESASAASIRLRDVLWAIRRDRLRTAREVDALAGRGASVPARAGYLAIQQALSAIDRMEVRGRDSAGIHLFVWDHGLDLDDPAVRRRRRRPRRRPDVPVGLGARVPPRRLTVLSFVYKAAAEIGELGDNTAAMRAAVAGRPPAAPGDVRARRQGERARPHPLGQRRHHQRAQRPPGQQR